MQITIDMKLTLKWNKQIKASGLVVYLPPNTCHFACFFFVVEVRHFYKFQFKSTQKWIGQTVMNSMK